MNNKFLKPSILYFCLCFLGYVIFLFVPAFRTGVFASFLMVLILIETGFFLIKSDRRSDFISLLNVTVLIYFVYNLLSFIWLVQIGLPFSLYAAEFSNAILPMVFYFVAVTVYSKDSGSKTDYVYKSFLFANTGLNLICLVLYVWAPQFYCDYLFNMSLISKADKQTTQVRMEGLTGSTNISYLGVAAMLVASKYMYESFAETGLTKKGAKIKDMDAAQKSALKKFVLYTILFFFSFVIVFMANGRAGMVAAILVIAYLNFLVFFSFGFAAKKYFYIEIGAVVVLLIAMCIVTPGVVAKVGARLISLPGAIGQRSEQWIAAINNMPAQWWGQWFGNGLGANGHKAYYIIGAHSVPDGGIVKLYCEEGAIGFALFVYIMMCTFRNGIKNLKTCFCELGIVGTALLMSIGSNIIAFQLCMTVFWFAAGVVAAVSAKEKETKMEGE